MWLQTVNIHNLSSVNRDTVWHLQWMLNTSPYNCHQCGSFVAASSELEWLNKLDYAFKNS